jgi:hypothetical protein
MSFLQKQPNPKLNQIKLQSKSNSKTRISHLSSSFKLTENKTFLLSPKLENQSSYSKN